MADRRHDFKTRVRNKDSKEFTPDWVLDPGLLPKKPPQPFVGEK